MSWFSGAPMFAVDLEDAMRAVADTVWEADVTEEVGASDDDLDDGGFELWAPDWDDPGLWHWMCSHRERCACPGAEDGGFACAADAANPLMAVTTDELPDDAGLCAECCDFAFDGVGGWGAAEPELPVSRSFADVWPQPVVKLASDPDDIRTRAVPVLPEAVVDWSCERGSRFALVVYDEETDELLAYQPFDRGVSSGRVALRGLPSRVYFHPVCDGWWRIAVRPAPAVVHEADYRADRGGPLS